MNAMLGAATAPQRPEKLRPTRSIIDELNELLGAVPAPPAMSSPGGDSVERCLTSPRGGGRETPRGTAALTIQSKYRGHLEKKRAPLGYIHSIERSQFKHTAWGRCASGYPGYCPGMMPGTGKT